MSLDATLYDSRILQFTLTGDMALRAGWGSQPQFVLAIGGFHPRFAAPPGLPALKRLALSLADGDTLQLRCEAYLAVTSNTVQFGARLDLHAAGGGFSFDGRLAFDALIQLTPLAFQVEVGAALALRYHGRLLMGISFSGSLAGPTPWQVQGKATIKILFFKVSVSFERQFGTKTPPPLPAAVDVVAQVAAALADRRNWSGTLPRQEPPVVTVRDGAAPDRPVAGASTGGVDGAGAHRAAQPAAHEAGDGAAGRRADDAHGDGDGQRLDDTPLADDAGARALCRGAVRRPARGRTVGPALVRAAGGGAHVCAG